MLEDFFGGPRLRIPDDVLRTIANGMAEAEAYLRALADGQGAEVSTRPRGGNYLAASAESDRGPLQLTYHDA